MAANALTAQLLAWIAERPRSYAETMEAWRTTCPRLTIWEDAVSDGLVAVEGAGPMREARAGARGGGAGRGGAPPGREGLFGGPWPSRPERGRSVEGREQPRHEPAA